MFGNGVKRKMDKDEDGLEEDGGLSKASCRSDMVLNMSLMKLYGPRTGPRLALQRQVLISNIIRRIHADSRQEGVGGGGALFFSQSYRQPPPSSFSIFSSPLSVLDSSLTPASLLEQDLPMFFTPSPSSSSLRPLEKMEELHPSSSSTPSPPPAWLTFDAIMKDEQPPPPLSSPASLTNFSLDDVLCADIDMSTYDLVPHSPPSGTPPPKAAMDDLVWSMSVCSGAQNQPFKVDLADLDHIMEVLVSS